MARHKKHEEHVNTEAWAIPYGDLVTLLLALFVVLYSTSSVNQGKYRVLAESMMAVFKGDPTSTSPVKVNAPAQGKAGDSSMSGVKSTTLMMKKDKPKDAVPAPGTAAPIADAKGTTPAAATTPIQQMAGAIKNALRDLIAKDSVRVRQGPHSLEVELRTDMLFGSGVAQLEPAAKPIIGQIADIIKPFPNTLRVEGHTDSRPITTAIFPSNWELSAARAANVVQLFSQTGVQSDRMTVVGFGDNHPVADNETAEGRNANRRVLIVVSDETTPDADRTDRAQATPQELAEIAPAPGTPGATVLSALQVKTPPPAHASVRYIALPPLTGGSAASSSSSPPPSGGGHSEHH